MSLILIIDNGGVGSKKLPKMVSTYGADVLVKKPPFDYSNMVPSGIIISGGSLDWNRHLEILEWYKQLILSSNIPILGICLGHRIIGITQGARTGRMHLPESGKVDIVFHRDYPLSPGVKNALVIERHRFELLSLPLEMVSYASSVPCDIQAIKHRTKPIFGIQFHVELGGQVGEVILGNFLRLCDEALVQDKNIS